MHMKKIIKVVTMAMTLTIAASGIALATPSTQIWIPSTDIQGYKTLHLGIDNYFRASGKGGNGGPVRDPNVYDIGLTAGVLPFEKVQLEIGADYVSLGN